MFVDYYAQFPYGGSNSFTGAAFDIRPGAQLGYRFGAAAVGLDGSYMAAWGNFGALGHFGPSLLTLHSGLAPDFVRSHKILAREICARYGRVIAVNPDIAAALTDAGVAAEHIVVCPAFTPGTKACQ